MGAQMTDRGLPAWDFHLISARSVLLVRRSAIIVSLLLVLLVTGCTREPAAATTPRPAPSTPSAQQPAQQPTPATTSICIETIVIQDGAFIPATLIVPKNCAIMFTNRSEPVVQIQGKDQPEDFLLGEMGKDQSWAHTYKTPGEYEFLNTTNPSMRGKITVRP